MGFVTKFTSKMVITGLFFYSKIRLQYIWKYRRFVPRPLLALTDRFFKTDACIGNTNCPKTIADRVDIRKAFLSWGTESLDVTTRLQEIKNREFLNAKFGRLGQFHVYIEDLFMQKHKMLSANEDSKYYLDVKYTGHADLHNKHSARTFAVRYMGRVGQDELLVFPPYSAHTPVSTGPGATRVIAAEPHSSNNNTNDEWSEKDDTDIANTCREYAGLKADFYAIHPDPLILKMHVTRTPATVTVIENGKTKTVHVKCKLDHDESVNS